MQTQVKWVASLSDGTRAYEGKNEYEEIEGELSPWQRLLKYIDKNGLKITSIGLYCGEQRWNLPSAGKNPKFRAFDVAEQPVSYRFYRRVGFNVLSGKREEEMFNVIEANYLDRILQTWVSQDGKSSWSLIC